MKYTINLEERTIEFSKSIIDLCKGTKFNLINKTLLNQLIRSGTSIGANYREANETETLKDFLNRIRISKKECKETIYWLDLVEYSNPDKKKTIEILKDEANQLMKILASIYLKRKI